MAIERKIVGAYELIDFPKFGLSNVQAKVDTGADTGALHCTQIREITGSDAAVLHFSPFDHPDLEFSTQDFVTRTVKSSNGTRQQRYFISTTVTIDGKEYPMMLSLADRSEMNWPVLIGRKFLKRHGFLVDVRKEERV